MMNRRQFCQKVVWFGGALALAPFIEGCFVIGGLGCDKFPKGD